MAHLVPIYKAVFQHRGVNIILIGVKPRRLHTPLNHIPFTLTRGKHKQTHIPRTPTRQSLCLREGCCTSKRCVEPLVTTDKKISQITSQAPREDIIKRGR
jgi:hypothetical protein